MEVDLTGKYVTPEGEAVMVRRGLDAFGCYLTIQGTEKDARPRGVGYRSMAWLRRQIADGKLMREDQTDDARAGSSTRAAVRGGGAVSNQG